MCANILGLVSNWGRIYVLPARPARSARFGVASPRCRSLLSLPGSLPMIRDTFVMRHGALVPKRLAAPLHRGDAAPMVISDLPEYRAAAADKDTGKRPLIDGRRQHREFLARNGYAEVGNDYVSPRREELSQADRVADIKRALGD